MKKLSYFTAIVLCVAGLVCRANSQTQPAASPTATPTPIVQPTPVSTPVATPSPVKTPAPFIPAKLTQTVMLGETPVKINIYETKGQNKITFFAPHHNEQAGTKIAKELIQNRGGRLVEIESLDERGRPTRRLKFMLNGAAYSIDPNRIFTENGRVCGSLSGDVDAAVKTFAEAILKILMPPDGKVLGDGERFLVALHNNTDADARDNTARLSDLTAFSFTRAASDLQISHSTYQGQAEGVYLSNTEYDEDNFVFVTNSKLFTAFMERGFHVVIQAVPAKLAWKDCSVDDGSLSVYSGKNGIPYVNLEADAANGLYRQRTMIEAVYQLLQQP